MVVRTLRTLLVASAAIALTAACSSGIDGEASLAAGSTTTPRSTASAMTAAPTTSAPPAIAESDAPVPPSSTSAETPPPAATTSTAPPPPPAPEPKPQIGPTTVGATCGSPSSVGIDVNSGQQIVCTYMGANGGLKWVDSTPIIGVNNAGAPCDSATDHVSQTPAGKAIMCVTGEWVYGP